MSQARVNIGEVLTRAFDDATSHAIQGPNLQRLHSQRSRQWITSLAQAFLSALDANNRDRGIRVFWRHQPTGSGCRDEFGLNELLYDVCVCETGEVLAGAKRLQYVRRALWAVESEFARDRAEAIKDFNKLVLSAAADKLFIGPHVRDAAAYRRTLEQAARECCGRVWLALVPHPDEWPEPKRATAAGNNLELWLLLDEYWIQMPVPAPVLS